MFLWLILILIWSIEEGTGQIWLRVRVCCSPQHFETGGNTRNYNRSLVARRDIIFIPSSLSSYSISCKNRRNRKRKRFCRRSSKKFLWGFLSSRSVPPSPWEGRWNFNSDEKNSIRNSRFHWLWIGIWRRPHTWHDSYVTLYMYSCTL